MWEKILFIIQLVVLFGAICLTDYIRSDELYIYVGSPSDVFSKQFRKNEVLYLEWFLKNTEIISNYRGTKDKRNYEPGIIDKFIIIAKSDLIHSMSVSVFLGCFFVWLLSNNRRLKKAEIVIAVLSLLHLGYIIYFHTAPTSSMKWNEINVVQRKEMTISNILSRPRRETFVLKPNSIISLVASSDANSNLSILIKEDSSETPKIEKKPEVFLNPPVQQEDLKRWKNRVRNHD
jgi:hypothetical protein